MCHAVVADFACAEIDLNLIAFRNGCLPGLFPLSPGIPQLLETPFLETGPSLARGYTPLILAIRSSPKREGETYFLSPACQLEITVRRSFSAAADARFNISRKRCPSGLASNS